VKQPKAKKQSPAQHAAGLAFAAGGRAAQARKRAAYRKTHHGMNPPATRSQKQAAAKGRAAQAARRQGKVPPKKAAAVAPAELGQPGGSGYLMISGCNDAYPTCAAAAVANHLLAATGLRMSEDAVLRLHRQAGGDDDGSYIEAVLEVLRATGWLFLGRTTRLLSFTRTDEDVIVSGLVVGVSLPHARHAVLSHPLGMVSWGQVMPWTGEPYEAWALDWQHE
jgi:hypothetical protein